MGALRLFLFVLCLFRLILMISFVYWFLQLTYTFSLPICFPEIILLTGYHIQLLRSSLRGSRISESALYFFYLSLQLIRLTLDFINFAINEDCILDYLS